MNYSQHELDAKILAFRQKKEHQFPELRNERYVIESADSIKPVEKHRTTKRSHLFPSLRLPHAA